MAIENKKHIGIIAKAVALFPEREIFLRSGGQVKFLHISTRLQIGVVTAIAAALILWAGATITMMVQQFGVMQERSALEQRSRELAGQARTISAYRKSSAGTVQDL